MRHLPFISWIANRVAGFFANRFVDFLNSEPTRTSGFLADYRTAKIAARDGDLPQAIKFAEEQLEKKPKQYEGLMLLASLYADAGHVEKAITMMNRILTNPGATGKQKQTALHEKDNYERLLVSGVIKPK
ncbi:MAG: tetratricopeptide repeat protein [Pedosphaera sp.]|nr:tetratricopeptide repeat protein [Pedosphaera sp.]